MLVRRDPFRVEATVEKISVSFVSLVEVSGRTTPGATASRRRGSPLVYPPADGSACPGRSRRGTTTDIARPCARCASAALCDRARLSRSTRRRSLSRRRDEALRVRPLAVAVARGHDGRFALAWRYGHRGQCLVRTPQVSDTVSDTWGVRLGRVERLQRGRENLSVVGPPGLLSSSKVPPTRRTRSPIPTSPSRPRCAAFASARSTSKPFPLSMICRSIALRRARTRTSTVVAPRARARWRALPASRGTR